MSNAPSLVGSLTIVVVLASVLTRVAMLRRRGIEAAKFGAIDKTDFLIPPFALFYVYLVFANTFSWPTPATARLFRSLPAAWVGVALCAVSVAILATTLTAFGTSFRIGIDATQPGRLVTSGIFARTRNPIYVAFAGILLAEVLILPTWLMMAYALAGAALFHRQVLREEAYLKLHYGNEYVAYLARVPRYL
jgi:protein-S-isoprenylcysteine O-methyltransferase Ste14